MIDERVILLTGGAGTELNALGARLTASGHVVHRLSSQGEAKAGSADLTLRDMDQIAGFIVQAVNEHGRLDAAVQYIPRDLGHDSDLNSWMHMVRDLVRMVVPIFRTQGHGLVLNVVPLQRPASDSMRIALAGAMKAYTEDLALCQQDHSVRALFMSPGGSGSVTRIAAMIATLLGDGVPDLARITSPLKSDPSTRLNIIHRIGQSKNLSFRGDWQADEREAVLEAIVALGSELESDTRALPRRWTFVKAAGSGEAPGPKADPTRQVCYAICRSDVHYPIIASTLEHALQKAFGISSTAIPTLNPAQIHDKISI